MVYECTAMVQYYETSHVRNDGSNGHVHHLLTILDRYVLHCEAMGCMKTWFKYMGFMGPLVIPPP